MSPGFLVFGQRGERMRGSELEAACRPQAPYARSVSPSLIAAAAASTRPDTPSFVRMLLTCTATVLRVM